jgi:hypothetical protein
MASVSPCGIYSREKRSLLSVDIRKRYIQFFSVGNSPVLGVSDSRPTKFKPIGQRILRQDHQGVGRHKRGVHKHFPWTHQKRQSPRRHWKCASQRKSRQDDQDLELRKWKGKFDPREFC